MNRPLSTPSLFRVVLVLLGVMMAALLSACGGGGGQVGLPTGKALFTTAPAGVTLAAGASASYTIGGGTPLYSVGTSNKDVATATVSGTSLTINAVGAGTVSITVTDAVGAALTVPVTVSAAPVTPPVPPGALFTTAPSAVTVAAGATAIYTAGGGKPAYSVSSSNMAVAKVAINGSDFIITGVASGVAQIIVLDTLGATVQIGVTVSGASTGALYTTTPSPLTIAPGASSSYAIGGGAPAYTANSSDIGIATVSVAGSTLTINGVAAGAAKLSIFDSLGASVQIDVTVSQVPISAVTVLPGSATGNVGDSLQFLVSGGTPGYTITINNTSIATVAPASVGATGGAFSVSLVNVGTTTATIVDARGQTATLPITANQTSTVLRLSPSALLISENTTGVIDLNIFGGTGPYRAFTSDQTLTGVSVTGAILTVGMGQNGNHCINPITEDGTYIPNGTFDITITAVDSLGASATSILTLKDNGRGPGVGCPP